MDKRHGGCVGEHMSPTYSFFPVVSFNHNLSQPKPTKRERKYVEGKEVGEETLKKKCRKSSLTDSFLNHGPPFKPPNSAIVDTYDRAVRFALLLKANPSANLFFE